MTWRLGLEPTDSWRRGDPVGNGKTGHRHEVGGWRWTTSTAVSDDLNQPVVELLREMRSRRETLRDLVSEGVHADVFAYWATRVSAGPWLEPMQMAGIADLGLLLLIDVCKD